MTLSHPVKTLKLLLSFYTEYLWYPTYVSSFSMFSYLSLQLFKLWKHKLSEPFINISQIAERAVIWSEPEATIL